MDILQGTEAAKKDTYFQPRIEQELRSDTSRRIPTVSKPKPASKHNSACTTHVLLKKTVYFGLILYLFIRKNVWFNFRMLKRKTMSGRMILSCRISKLCLNQNTPANTQTLHARHAFSSILSRLSS